jgi:hypothetical protein
MSCLQSFINEYEVCHLLCTGRETDAAANSGMPASELQEGRDLDNLEKIRKLLGLAPYSPKAQLNQFAKHRDNVLAEFGRKNWYSEKPGDERLREVATDPDYEEWLHSPLGRVLILSGQNDVSGARHCWLSPVALDLIANLTATDTGPRSSDLCLFYLLGHREEDDTCPHVLAFLTFRLLALNVEALRDEEIYVELWPKLQSYAEIAKSPEMPQNEVQEALEGIALMALNLFDTRKVIWIVLDRVDQCRAPSRWRGNSQRKDGMALVKTIVRLVNQAKVTVKVLAVVNKVDWHVEEQEEDVLGAAQEGSVVIRTFNQYET